MMLIGLSGYAGAGKDLFAQLASERTGCARMAFANALRLEVAQAFGISPAILLDRETKGTPNPLLRADWCTDLAFAEILRARGRETYSPRDVMQLWGTEYRRAEDPHYWITRAAASAWTRALAGNEVCLVTDCRFPDEASWIEAQGGQIWRIDRPGVEPTNEHRSERAIDDWPFALRIRNDGSIEQLRKIAFDLVSTRLSTTAGS